MTRRQIVLALVLVALGVALLACFARGLGLPADRDTGEWVLLRLVGCMLGAGFIRAAVGLLVENIGATPEEER